MTHTQNELHALRTQFRTLASWSKAAAEQLQELIADTQESGNAQPKYLQSLVEEFAELMQKFGLNP